MEMCAPTTDREGGEKIVRLLHNLSGYFDGSPTVKTDGRSRFSSCSQTTTIDNAMATDAFNPKSVLELDPWLEPFLGAIDQRYQLFKRWKDTIAETEGGYDKFTKGYLRFGLNAQPDNSVVYREWAPNAISAALTGDFSLSSA
jgi:hypothetical protein